MTVTEPERAYEGTGPDVGGGLPAARPRPGGRNRYTISEVAARTGLSPHTLRWYERIGLMPHVDRSHTGQRRFSDEDLGWLALVATLRLTGMPVADMVRYAELVRTGRHTYPQRLELLEATRRDVRHRISVLQGTLAVLDHRIDRYALAGTDDTDVPDVPVNPGVSAGPGVPAGPGGQRGPRG